MQNRINNQFNVMSRFRKRIRRDILTKRTFYLIFITAPLSGTFVEHAMRISLKLLIKEYLDLYLEITRLHTTLFSQKSTLLGCGTNAFKISSYCYIRVCFSLIFLLI